MPISAEFNEYGANNGEAASPQQPADDLPHGLGEIMVQFAPDVGLDAREAAAQAVGGHVVEDIQTKAMQDAGQGVLSRISVADEFTLEHATEVLSRTADVLHVSASAQGGIADGQGGGAATVPGDPSFSNDPYYQSGQLWGMYGDETSPSDQYGSQAGEAWAAGYTGSTQVAIGVVDSGIDPAHPDLYLNIWLNNREIPKDLGVADTDGESSPSGI